MRSGSTGTCIKGSGWLFVHRNSLYNPLPWTRWGVVPIAFGVFGVGHKKGIALRGQPNTNVCHTLRLMGIFWEVLSLFMWQRNDERCFRDLVWGAYAKIRNILYF